MAAREELRGLPYEVIPFATSATGFTIKAAQAGKHIVVVGYHVVSHVLDLEISFVSGDVTTGGNDITGALTGDEIFSMTDRDREYGCFWTRKGEALKLKLGGIDPAAGYVLIVLADEMPALVPMVE